ncbi:MAG: hypothetical protein B7Z33_06330 [Sphingomonadales bacterium 12-68-11]|nr:MAG: hypothetical protein B7Z33_06330 [Sphingomonadales bacterium 12-68-11]
MNLWTAIVVIVALLCLTELFKAKHRARHGIVTDMMGNEKPVIQENGELKREVEDLRERIKVLERIATDERGTRHLADQIESLRDK